MELAQDVLRSEAILEKQRRPLALKSVEELLQEARGVQDGRCMPVLTQLRKGVASPKMRSRFGKASGNDRVCDVFR